MYYTFLLISLLSVCTNTFSMNKEYYFFNMKCEELRKKDTVKNDTKKPFFLKDLRLLRLSPETIKKSAILTRMVDDETNITNTLPFKKQDIPHIQSILQNNIDTISQKDLERCFEIANYLHVPDNILFPLAERYTCSWYPKNKRLVALAKKCGSLAQLTYDELADQVTITNDSLTYDVQCSINLENKALYSLHGFEKFFELIEHKNLVTEISLKNNALILLNTELLSSFPNLKVIDVSQNNLSWQEKYKLHVTLFVKKPYLIKNIIKTYFKISSVATGLYILLFGTLMPPFLLAATCSLEVIESPVLQLVCGISFISSLIAAKKCFKFAKEIRLDRPIKIISNSQKNNKK